MSYTFNPFTGNLDVTPFSLDGAGKIPPDYLPSYVDDVVEYDDLAGFPGTGETGKIYVAKDTGYTYRWTGSVYVRIGSGGEVELNLGSAGSPSLFFNGDANTGLYSPGADQVAISTNGTERLRIDSSGNVGIGTSSPSALFHSVNTSAGAATVAAAIQNSSLTTNTEVRLALSPNTNPITDSRYSYVGSVNEAGSTSVALTFGTGAGAAPTERLRIDSSGRVGIGTTNPTQKLQVTDGTFSNFYIAPGYNSDAGTTIGVGGGEYLAFNGAPFTTERMRIDSSGRLLVGTSSSSNNGLLQIKGNAGDATSYAYLSLQRGSSPGTSADLGYIDFTDNSGNQGAWIQARRDGGTWTSGSSHPTFLGFSTTADGASSPTERMRITSDAYVRLASGTGGIQFNGDTAAANALDDYEEGTFTPTIIGTATAGTATYTGQVGKYTKVGNLVTCSIYLNYSGGNGTGNMRIAGLPFTVVSGGSGSLSFGIFSNIALAANSVATGYANELTSLILLLQYPSGGGQYTFISYDTAGEILTSFAYYT